MSKKKRNKKFTEKISANITSTMKQSLRKQKSLTHESYAHMIREALEEYLS